MNTVTEHMRDMRKDLDGLLARLMEASAIRERNLVSDVLVIVGPTYRWCDLDLEGKRIQSKFFDNYDRFIELIRALLTGRSAETRADRKRAMERYARSLIRLQPPEKNGNARRRDA